MGTSKDSVIGPTMESVLRIKKALEAQRVICYEPFQMGKIVIMLREPAAPEVDIDAILERFNTELGLPVRPSE